MNHKIGIKYFIYTIALGIISSSFAMEHTNSLKNAFVACSLGATAYLGAKKTTPYLAHTQKAQSIINRGYLIGAGLGSLSYYCAKEGHSNLAIATGLGAAVFAGSLPTLLVLLPPR